MDPVCKKKVGKKEVPKVKEEKARRGRKEVAGLDPSFPDLSDEVCLGIPITRSPAIMTSPTTMTTTPVEPDRLSPTMTDERDDEDSFPLLTRWSAV